MRAVAELTIPAFFINLERRPDRLQEMRAELESVDLTAERIDGIDGQMVATEKDLRRHRRSRARTIADGRPVSSARGSHSIAGMVGCCLSQQAMLARAAEVAAADRAPAVLCMEDDVEFAPGFRDRWPELVASAPPDWKVLLIGGRPCSRPVEVAPGWIASPAGTWGMHAYVVRTTALPELSALIADRWTECDISWKPMHTAREAVVAWPALAWQRRSHSDIAGQTVNRFSPHDIRRKPR